MDRYERLGAYARRMGVTYQTAWRWARDGKIDVVRVGGSLFVSNEESTKKPGTANRAALYSRVSSSQNKDNLEAQENRLRAFAAAKGYTVTVSVAEVGSGLNDNRPKLAKMFTRDDWDILVVEHKDRLTSFGFRYLEWLTAATDKKVEVINTTSDDTDLMDDLVSIITSFSARINGQRRPAGGLSASSPSW